MTDKNDSGTSPDNDPAVQLLLAEIAGDTAERAPARLTAELRRLVDWVRQGGAHCVDDVHVRWHQVAHVFRDLDLSIWEEQPVQVEELAVLLAELDYYRQIDLSIDERIALLLRARKLLSPRHYLGLAKIDLERAELESMRGSPEDLEEALTLCDDALACVEQLDDEHRRADALLSRAMVLLRMGRHREATAEAEKAREVYERLDVPGSLAYVCRHLAHVNIAADRMANAVPLLREALTLYERVQDSPGMAHVLTLRAVTWKARGSVPKALEDCESAVRRFDRARMRTWQGRAMLQRAGYLSNLARYMEAQYDLEQAVRYLAESPEPEVLIQGLLALSDVLRRRNAQGEAAGRLDEAEAALLRVTRPRARVRLLLGVAWAAKELSTPDRARIRRCGAEALMLARALGDEANEGAAKDLLSFAG